MFYKLILDPPSAELQFQTWILHLPTTIGRNPEHGVFIDHVSVSRTHCQLMLNGQGGLMVKDLNSTNGTYVRDQRIQHQTEIFPGDTIQVGAVSFRIEYESDTEVPKPAEKPEAFDLTTTVPMETLKKGEGEDGEKKWWKFWDK